MERRITAYAASVFVALLLHGAAGVHAQVFPAEPIRMLVPYPAGGSFDIFARVVGQKMASALGQQIVVDNRGGASGLIAADLTARAAPDGHTILFGGIGPLATLPLLNPKITYDPLKDFAPLSLVGTAPHILVVHPALPVKTVQDLIALAKAKPGQLNYASGGVAGPPHLAGELLKYMTGTNIVHVPYTGGNQATTGTVSGQVQLYFSSMASAVPLVKDGRLRALAVTCSKRSAMIPEVPTVAESGVPGYELLTWFMLVAPARTPQPVVTQLNREIVNAMSAADVQKRFTDLATDPVSSTSAEALAFIRSEMAKWTKVIKAAGITAE